MDKLDLLFPEAVGEWTPDRLLPYRETWRHRSPEQLLEWALRTFSPIALATSFGPSGIVTMAMVARLRPQPTTFYLDTGLLFPETYRLRDQLAEQLHLQFTQITPELGLEAQVEQYGEALWASQPDLCCQLRKVRPLRHFLASQQAWITGIRRDQGGSRATIEPIEWDYAHNLVKLNPLAYWTREQVWDYIREHDLPYNRLHDEQFASIGCIPCTRPVTAHEPERAGRWAGQVKTECGIHIQPDGKVRRV